MSGVYCELTVSLRISFYMCVAKLLTIYEDVCVMWTRAVTYPGDYRSGVYQTQLVA